MTGDCCVFTVFLIIIIIIIIIMIIIIIILYSNTEYKEYLKRRTMRLSLFRSPN